MQVLLINGSPRKDGNTAQALREMMSVFQTEEIQCTLLQIGGEDIRGCIACGSCRRTGRCAFDDTVNRAAELLKNANGLVIGSPVYYASANGTLISLLDRLFHSTPFDKTMIVGASVAAARRSGLTATYDELNKYFAISGMPIASGQYWNGIHGTAPGEGVQDLEGMQMMRTLAHNMVFLMRSIELGKKEFGLPARETPVATNFVRSMTHDESCGLVETRVLSKPT